MPKKICTIWLEITDVRVERLYSITEDDARKEGFADTECFKDLWCELNGIENYMMNPWVWVIEFRVMERKNY